MQSDTTRHARPSAGRLLRAGGWIALSVAPLVAGLLGGCSGQAGAGGEIGRYVHYNERFSLRPPDGWALRQWSGQPCLWLIGPGDDEPGRPTLNVVVVPARTGETLQKALAADRRQMTVLRGYEAVSEEPRLLNGGTRAVVVTFRHEGLGRSVTVRQLRAVALGRVYTLTAAAASDRFADLEETFEACLGSFRIEP